MKTAREYGEELHRRRLVERVNMLPISEADMSWRILHGPQPVIATFGSHVWLLIDQQAENIAALQLHWAEAFLA